MCMTVKFPGPAWPPGQEVVILFGSPPWERWLSEQPRTHAGELIAFKVVKRPPRSPELLPPFTRIHGSKTPYQAGGWNEVPKDLPILSEGYLDTRLHGGVFHACLTLEAAEGVRRRASWELDTPRVGIFPILIRPEDVVAVGYWRGEGRNAFPQIATRRFWCEDWALRESEATS